MLTCGGSAKLLTSASGERGNRWSPGHTPVTVRGFSVAKLATSSLAKVVWQLRLVTTIGKTSTSGQTQATLTVASGAHSGQVFYRKTNFTCKPTQELAPFVVTKATAANSQRLVIYVEPAQDEPANNTKMTLVTA